MHGRKEVGRRQVASLAGSGRALYVLAGSLDLILEPGDPLNKGFETGVIDSESHCTRWFWLQCGGDQREGSPEAVVRSHCDHPVRSGDPSLGHLPTPPDRTKLHTSVLECHFVPISSVFQLTYTT